MYKLALVFILVTITGKLSYAHHDLKEIECSFATASIPKDWDLKVSRNYADSHFKYKKRDVAVAYNIYSKDLCDRIILCKITWNYDLNRITDEDVLPLATPFVKLLGGGEPSPVYCAGQDMWRINDTIPFTGYHRNAYIRREPFRILMLIIITTDANDDISQRVYESWGSVKNNR